MAVTTFSTQGLFWGNGGGRFGKTKFLFVKTNLVFLELP